MSEIETDAKNRLEALWDCLGKRAELSIERDRLQRWKDEMLPVLDGMQELGRALDLPLGEQISGEKAREAVEALKTENQRLRGAFSQTRDWVDRLIDERDRLAETLERVRGLVPLWQAEADEFRYDYELQSAETLGRARLELLRALTVREGGGGEVFIDDNDPCPGHENLDGHLIPCTLPYGHRAVPTAIEGDGGES